MFEESIIVIGGGIAGLTGAALLAKEGYDKIYGARPLGRLIQESIKKDLAEELLFGSLKDGGTAFIDLVKNKLKIKIESNNKNNENKKVETVKTSI